MSAQRLRQPIKYRPIRTPRHSAANPAQRIAAESEETSCPTKKPRRRRGFVSNRKFLSWSRVRESNPPQRLGKPLYYRCTNPAYLIFHAVFCQRNVL